jgi:hypothetical protein
MFEREGTDDRLSKHDPYRAFSSTCDQPIAVKFSFRNGGGISIPYDRLGRVEFFPGHTGLAQVDVIILRFNVSRIESYRPWGPVMTGPLLVLTIEGRALRPLWRQLKTRRIRWIRELPEGHLFPDGSASVITDITVDRRTEIRA